MTTPEIEVVLQLDKKTQYGNSEVFTSEIGIMNIGSSEHTLEFSNSCFGEIWIVDASGKVVMDSRDLKECSESNADYTIAPGEDKILAQRDWNFIDRDGCPCCSRPIHSYMRCQNWDYSLLGIWNIQENLEIIVSILQHILNQD